MFNIKVTYGSGNSMTVTQPVLGERLPEAEASAISVLNRLFPDIDFVLVHHEDLTYCVYQVDEPFAYVNIATGDVDV